MGRSTPPHRPDDDARAAVLAGVARYVDEQVQALRTERDGALRGDPEAVHRWRVAARRLRSALATWEPVLGAGPAAGVVRERLRVLGADLAGARDADVLREHLSAALDAEAGRDGADEARELIAAHLAVLVDRGRLRARDALTSGDVDGVVDDALAVLAVARPAAAGRAPVHASRAVGTAVDVLERDWRRLRRRVRAASALDDGPELDRALHDVRKAAKRLRYAAESAVPLLGARATALAARAEAVQEALGTHQDSVVARDVLEEVARHASGPAGLVLGRLHAAEEARARQARLEHDRARRRLRGSPRRRLTAGPGS